jgi:hypothetical protein
MADFFYAVNRFTYFFLNAGVALYWAMLEYGIDVGNISDVLDILCRSSFSLRWIQ